MFNAPAHSAPSTRSPRALLAVAALCAALGGCAAASSSFTAVTDGVGSAGKIFSSPRGEATVVPMFVASTRRGAGEGPSDGTARFSLVSINVPASHKAGSIETPSFGAANPEKHFTVQRRRTLDEDAFKGELAAHVSGRVGNNRDILLYVHGFNTGLDEARFRLAQIASDGSFGGVPVLFAWQSKGELFAYESDKENATFARDALVNLLSDLSQTPGIGRIHVLAHSMGTWLSMEALRESAIAGRADLGGHLGNVMLAAPDIDLAVFRQQIARLDPTHISVFVSRGDRALSLSAKIAGGQQRLGAMNPDDPKDQAALKSLGVKVYDLSQFSSGLVGHGTFAEAPDAVRQIGATLTKRREADADVQAVINASGGPALGNAPIQSGGAIVGEALPPPPAR